MRPVVRYQADDGSIWPSPEEAQERDAEFHAVRKLCAELGMRPAPDTIDFGNGRGFVQHPEGTRAKLLAWLRERGAHRDSDGPIGDAMHRMWRIDSEDREWGQTYYALHPGKGRMVEVSRV